ncbi:hypothetical protein M8C21_006523 [Ambrosia artemisiifolia]|uniref:Uncharacterized protein n=1 Tax=Ambrosia artemisiifolia TaxID=4212 RepID=A0AAD5DES7_AMBAR|nr:hypothetical protein M8C21_006523 [Ambrosia artemisiifolia]
MAVLAIYGHPYQSCTRALIRMIRVPFINNRSEPIKNLRIMALTEAQAEDPI